MDDKDWLSRATTFDMGGRVEIERRRQRESAPMWVVNDGGYVLNKSGDWEYEPQPSSRTDDFIARTRFATRDEALAAYEKARSCDESLGLPEATK